MDIPRCGDHVFHRPTEETWVVAWCEGDDLAWCGWPNGMARTSDCELVHRASEAEHRASVRRVADVNDSRGPRVRRLYAAALAGQCSNWHVPAQDGVPESVPLFRGCSGERRLY